MSITKVFKELVACCCLYLSLSLSVCYFFRCVTGMDLFHGNIRIASFMSLIVSSDFIVCDCGCVFCMILWSFFGKRFYFHWNRYHNRNFVSILFFSHYVHFSSFMQFSTLHVIFTFSIRDIEWDDFMGRIFWCFFLANIFLTPLNYLMMSASKPSYSPFSSVSQFLCQNTP